MKRVEEKIKIVVNQKKEKSSEKKKIKTPRKSLIDKIIDERLTKVTEQLN